MEQVLDDIQYLRTGDHLTLIAQIKLPVVASMASVTGGGVGKHGGRLSIAGGMSMHSGASEPVLELIRVSLAADGFGTHLSHLENLSNHDVPGDIVSSTFLCENALSKKALQEQLLMDSSAKAFSNNTGSGYKTLLYGHAVCFKHVQSEKFLACMASSPQTDKLAFEIGLVENTIERAWWIIEPSNKQRSEGDKVKIGDEVILISVSSERYMHAALPIFCPLASFQPSCWAMGIVKRGDVEGTTMGYVKGGDTIRLQKGFDECLSVVEITQRSNAPNSSPVTYEFDDGRWEGRSLWRIEFVRSKWNASCLQWGQPMRVRHVVSGRYLTVKDNMTIGLCESAHASCSSTLFAFYSSKEDEEVSWDLMQEPSQGQPCIKYNEHPVCIKHVDSQSWLSYAVIDSKVPGKISGKRAVLLPDGHVDDCFVIRVSQYEESMTSRFIMKALKFFNRFIVALKSMTPVDPGEEIWQICSVQVVTHLIEDLIAYFAPPEEEMDHEKRQTLLKNLKIRQDLFQAEGFILVIREMVDRLKHYREYFASGTASVLDDTGQGQGSVHVSSDNLEQFDEISSLLFELLASLIRGNRVNCSKFSEPASLDWLMSRLHFAHKQDALDVLYCLLQSSPEAVNIFTETHIKILLNMIDKFGKDHKVLEVMRTLCVSQNEAVRANQNLFLQHFTTHRKDHLTFQTRITEQIVNVRPNVFIGMAEGSAMYYKWYFEVHVENILRYPHTHLRIGWANTTGFHPHSTRGSAGWGGNGVGDDMFSWGFDGKNLWTDGSSYPVQGTRGLLQYDDVIGCCVDFTVPRISFTLNGIPVLGVVESFPVFDSGLFHPVASMSSLIQIRFVLGGKHGSFAYKPPEGYAPVCELVSETSPPPSLMSHCVDMNTQNAVNESQNQHSVSLHGPSMFPTETAFHPQPVDLQKVNLTGSVIQLRRLMAEWFHEQWSIAKIEAGWIYGEQGIDENRRYHDCLKPFSKLNEEQQYVEIMTADEIIRTVLALGYTIKSSDNKRSFTPKRINLPNNYVLSNGYKPAPFDISIVQLGPVMSKLVELLAENTHNIWAEAKIARNWTYGAQDSASMKRTPLLTEYKNLDPVARKGVRNSAIEAIKLIVVLGYRIEAPIVEISENMLSRKPVLPPEYRVYRADFTRSVLSGKLYFEFEPYSDGFMLVGWAHKGLSPTKLPSCDPSAFLFNGFKGEKQNQVAEKFGKKWVSGDTVGCFIDIEQRSIGFSLNGQMMMDVTGRESAFDHFDIHEGIVPVFCLARGESGKVNFGNDPNSLRFYFTNAYHQGYVPLCFETRRPLPLWVSLRSPHFRSIDNDSEKCCFKSTKTTSSASDGTSFPALKITYEGHLSERSFGKLNGHFLRLCLPIPVTGKMPLKPAFLTEMEINNANILSKNAQWAYASGGGQFSGQSGHMDRTIMEEQEEEDPDLNRPPVEYSKIRKKQDPTSLLALFQPTSSKANSKKQTAANLKLLQKHRADNHSDEEESEDEQSCVIGFADEALKNIMKTRRRPSAPFKNTNLVLGVPHMYGQASSPKGVKKFEELFNFDQNGSVYQYSVRVYQGQDTASMLVGWSSSSFSGKSSGEVRDALDSRGERSRSGRHLVESTARNAFIKVFDNNGGAKVYQRRNLYMASVSDLCVEAFPNSSSSFSQGGAPNNALTGLQIDILLDTNSGLVSFLVNKIPCSTSFMVESGQSLYPCVYVRPTCKDTLQIELTRSMTALPLSCVWLNSDLLTNFFPECPPSLHVEVNDSTSWLSLPDQAFQAAFINAADKGWRVLTDVPVKFCSLLQSESNSSLDILELSERSDWLLYHCNTLQLYCSMCEHGNHKAAHVLTELIDEKQLLFLIQCNRLPGKLRMEFFNLLISMHFQYRTTALLSTAGEFIFTLSSDHTQSLPDLQPKELEVDLSRMEFPHLIQPEIEPVLPLTDVPKNFNYAKLGPPKINTDELKHIVLRSLEQALPPAGETSFQQQDPAGGSHSYFLVPCLKLINCLLINGFLSVSEMQKLVTILDPKLLDKKSDSGSTRAGKGKPEAVLGGEGSAGLLNLELDEMAKVELIKLMSYLKNNELKQIIGQLVLFANNFVGEGQFDQRRRYVDIMGSCKEESPSVLAWKTKEFRCKPFEQIKSMISFRNVEKPFSPCRKDMQELLNSFHHSLLEQIGVAKSEDGESIEAKAENEKAPSESRISSFFSSLASWISRNRTPEEVEILMACKGTTFRETVVAILIQWAKSSQINDDVLIESLFLMLFQQYDEITQLTAGLEKTYVVSGDCEVNVRKLLTSLCTVRQLLNVAMGPDEEKTMIDAISDLTFSTVFYQHPELIRKLSVHQSVMTVMVNIMSNSMSASSSASKPEDEDTPKGHSAVPKFPNVPDRERRASIASGLENAHNEWNSEIVSSCCRFLSFFCRTSAQSQKAVFEKLDFLLENITMGLAYPSLRGSTPLDVAAAAIKNNSELALALRQHHLESVVGCLCDCGLASNPTLLQRGVADIGWDPVVGERLLDFLKTTVWVSGESVEQNAFQIVRMLVRRPECLGPALRAGGKGLLQAVGEAIELQKSHNAVLHPQHHSAVSGQGSEGKSGDEMTSESMHGVMEDPGSVRSWNDDRSSMIVFNMSNTPGGDSISIRKEGTSYRMSAGNQSAFSFNVLEPSPDNVQIGDAVLDFYAALINLLGCCSPAGFDSSSDPKSELTGNRDDRTGGETQRVRSILQSLVPMEDLQGILGMSFSLPSMEVLQQVPVDSLEGENQQHRQNSHWVGPLKPHHKASIVRFWDRVYGIEEAETLEQLISIGFLPDLRTAIILDTPSVAGADFSVSLNRYLCQTVLPLLTRNAKLFKEAAETCPNLVETFLITIYRFYRCRTLSNAQKHVVSDFLSCVIQYVRPQAIHNFLMSLSQHLADLEPHTEVIYDALSTFLQHNRNYYCSEENSDSSSIHGIVSDEEKSLLLRMFETFFDALIRSGDLSLVHKAMPALLSLVGTIAPDYCSRTSQAPSIKSRKRSSVDPKTGQYVPISSNIDSINLSKDLAEFSLKLSEQVHDEWAKEMLEQGWTYGLQLDEDNKKSANLKPFKLLHDHDVEDYKSAIRQKLRIAISLGFHIDKVFAVGTDAPGGSAGGTLTRAGKMSTAGGNNPVVAPPSIANYRPTPVDLSSVSLSNELIDLANLVGECCHDFANHSILNDPSRRHRPVEHNFVPYELLTEEEKSREWRASHNFIKYLIVSGFEITKSKELEDFGSDSSLSSPANQKRFSLILLEKVMVNAERASKAIKDTKTASLIEASVPKLPEIVMKFAHVVIPVVHRYVYLHRPYYIGMKEDMPRSLNEGSDAPTVYASVREKELLLGLFCRLFASLREQKTSRNTDVRNSTPGYIECTKAIAEALEFSAISSSSNPTVLGLVHIFFLSVVNELKSTRQQITASVSASLTPTLSNSASLKEVNKEVKFIFAAVLPVLKLVLKRIGSRDAYGQAIIVGETQLCCYELLEQLYLLGADDKICTRKQRAMIGDCLAEFARAFPVAFLEPHMNEYNKLSIANNKDLKKRFETLCVDVPTLEEILNEVNIMAIAAAAHAANKSAAEECYDPLLVIEVLLPMTCIYLSSWVYKGPDYELVDSANYPTNVTHNQLNSLLSNVLSLITNNFGVSDAVWMNKVAQSTQPIWKESLPSMLSTHYLPALRNLAEEMDSLVDEETRLKALWQTGKDTASLENDLQEGMGLLMRDIYCFFPFLLTFMEQERIAWSREMPPEVYQVFELVTSIFSNWAKSQSMRREESNVVCSNLIDSMAYISGIQSSFASAANDVLLYDPRKHKKKKKQTEPHTFHTSMSLIMVACKRMIPVGLAFLHADVQELIQSAKQKFLEKATDVEVLETIKTTMQQFKSNSKSLASPQNSFDGFDEKSVLHISKVLQRLHFVDHPPLEKREAETKLLSKARKRSVMQCFKMAPLYSMPRHKAVNLFVRAYHETWLSQEEQHGKDSLIESLTETDDASGSSQFDPLTQLVAFIKRAAQSPESEQTDQSGQSIPSESLYISYAELMSNSCSCEEEDEEGAEEGKEPTFEEQEMAKQKLLCEQARLKERGVAEMVLLRITQSTGTQSEVAEVTLQLGISVLTGGNVDVQTTMLQHLLEKKDVAFFNSVAGFMQSCSVLNLDSFERCNQAEDQGSSGVSSGGSNEETSGRVMDDASFTTKLFRFLQLLCEGHNSEWQNYLRVQEGNTTSVNLINASVDYLVRLQESMSDFYWHYSAIEEIDTRGRLAFMVAIQVGKQVFASLTEMVQGPCTGNQLALTHSRLWDAVSGFFHLFANLQLKLSQDPEQMEFLRELMDLQKEMVTLLLSMLEGNVLNGPIGKQMVDTLALCSQNVQDVLQFFTTFLKYAEIVAGVSFQDYDLNGDGIIQPSEFRKVLKSQKVYTDAQVDFLVDCADKDSDGRISYKEFSERFSDPASEIGFNIALLFTNLSEHTTNDARLEQLVEAASDLIEMFESQLGRIEILGGTKRIERVYFEISEENKSSWEAETIKESKREFLFSGVVGMPDMEKLDTFVNFCEDTIYEMQHTRSLYPQTADDSLPPSKEQSWHKRLTNWTWELAKSSVRALVISPWAFLLFLLKMTVFLILKVPYWISVKLPYVMLRTVVWTPIVSLLRLTIRMLVTKPIYFTISLLKRIYRKFAAIFGSKLGTPKTTGSLRRESGTLKTSTSLSPMSDLVRVDGEPTGTPGTELRLRNRMSVSLNAAEVQAAVNELDSESLNEEQEEHNQKPSTSANQDTVLSKFPAHLRLYEEWMKDRKVDSFDYSNEFASQSKVNQSGDNDSGSSGKNNKNKQSLPLRVMCLLARNYYRVKAIGAILSFFINIILLFCRISIYLPEGSASGSAVSGSGEYDSSEPVEVVIMGDDVQFLEPVLRVLSVLHAFVSLLILLAYYKLKVPLVLFQREKEVCRKLEFEGLYLTSQPDWNDFRAKLDSIVISSRSFPLNFWDKFVKKRARGKYSETVGEEEIDVVLGLAQDQKGQKGAVEGSVPANANASFMSQYDVQYNLWKFGVIFSDHSFLYIFFYFLFSIAGNFSRFFFAIHLMDIAFGNKDLSAILRSVTHNGKQLVLTALLTSIVIYLYTVVAFNFFRGSYVEEAETSPIDTPAQTALEILNHYNAAHVNNDSDPFDHGALFSSEQGVSDDSSSEGGGGVQQKCDNMWQCFIFHLHHGLRAGGGIGDEIEDPDGQDLMYWRIMFDMTFFFFVIVILLAIIQGLIIDAFGELRGQLEQTKEDLENKCFICGLGKEYFDEQAAHGFEIHSEKEHNFANYMFFLMYLINKDETEFTGQETYVWNLYQARNFDFFPLGDCFRKQYEEELKD